MIDKHRGKLSMEFGGRIFKVDIFDPLKLPVDVTNLCALSTIDKRSVGVIQSNKPARIETKQAKTGDLRGRSTTKRRKPTLDHEINIPRKKFHIGDRLALSKTKPNTFPKRFIKT